jgi:hypothetical protein
MLPAVQEFAEGEEFIVHGGAPPTVLDRRVDNVNLVRDVVVANGASYEAGTWVIWEYTLEYIEDKKYLHMGRIMEMSEDRSIAHVKWFRTHNNEFRISGRYKCYNHRHREEVPINSIIYVFGKEFRLNKDGSIPSKDRSLLEVMRLGSTYCLEDPPQPPTSYF